MRLHLIKRLLLMASLAIGTQAIAQNQTGGGQVHGNTQIDAQIYQIDKGIGIDSASLNGKKFGVNGYTNLNYTNGKFSAGVRMEGYLPQLNGFEENYNGVGIPYAFAKYTSDQFEITAGSFYEQFGSGIILRSYQEWNLGIDNSILGARIVFRPIKGITLTGIYGSQRYFWVKYENENRGIVRGGDLNVDLNTVLGLDTDLQINFGGSFVSRFQKDNNPLYKLPQNVGAGALRLNLAYKGFDFYSEYARKGQDPNAINNNIYKYGEVLYSTLSYSTRGFGAMAQFKRIDNFSFKSDRNITGQALDINYLPAITKQQTYALATLFPYATQPNGEIGFSGQVSYKFSKGSALGGKYGTLISLEVAEVNNIEKTPIDGKKNITPYTDGYTSSFFKTGSLLYRTVSFDISKKFNRKFKGGLTYLYVEDNIAEVEVHAGEPSVFQQVIVLDATHKIGKDFSLHWEAQAAFVNDPRTYEEGKNKAEDAERAYQGRRGNWAGALVELSYHDFFAAAMDQYNYQNQIKDFETHYYTFSAGYTHNTSRLAVSYGRQREGLLCIGGVCRTVPAASGFTISLSTSF